MLSFAQDFNETLNSIRGSETKSASKKMRYKTNLNTGKYDVTYHRLEFTLNPSTIPTMLSGVVTTHIIAK
jgi:hypothetical protein